MALKKPDELFYCDKKHINRNENIALLSGQEAIHCSKVLRYKEGDEVYFTDAQSSLFTGIITRIKKGEVDIQITDSNTFLNDSQTKYPILCMGVLKNKERMEWLVEKAIEIGVFAINFIQLSRSERSQVNLERFTTIALSAMKQSQRLQIPELSYFAKLEDCLALQDYVNTQHFVAHEKVDVSESVHTYFSKDIMGKRPVFWIGPEGGFTEEEVDELKNKACAIPISLGQFRLRAETAALFVLAKSV